MVMLHEQPDYDVGIVGRGPAGGAIAAYLAKAGVKCILFERELFPHPHVGESLVPSSTRVFKDLDLLPVMEAAGFPHKYGAVWTAAGSSRAYEHGWDGLEAECRADIRFEEREQAGVDQNYTYHVDRGKFDKLLRDRFITLLSGGYEKVDMEQILAAAGEPDSTDMLK